ncbi:TrbI/VirB10 family protein [Mesorhizobium sp. M8A.F.Ca.ET.208.01.1.1]|uniref:TrbI/VirB10 family protein n=1 Tax=unclassified Mesorhizobium TaxID=325217 RepID=UPI0010919B43|nr:MULTISPECIES: TrbI/VirB10 family protein [unclassified Mesorhizobium]TGU40045.1 TrbI/VirB10 family protein [bacterium M00.F.Ca.ET.156.01.1.1]TGV15167.1 TrbI/VirB10 family protein [Mesorhizobium sp. M8A.F.Ca.ET.173.01.1.1]TGQ89062.1 TrbI/VirB10 family protein [Mesorhizobium sp. M8A.F.Ca.ET.208.01.1.1]TGR32167.1 TrbI/VirB10 family protein [Mesorhizobium sp. M8A.F.Ca.ET.202.01.1.1]TGT50382.1 TrbI/VirB10 family protein [Mesorhizobium sp. M8A.F.Ca.ET.167.01.1.1]
MNENEIPAAPMQLRADPPRVTRLSRKVLAGISLCASLGVGGALIYALQTSETGRHGDELYSTSNRQPADGLASLPRDYTGPVLGPPLPGDLGRPMLDAQNKGQPVVPPTIATPMVDEAEQRRRAEEEAARTSRVFFQTGQSTAAMAETPPGGTSPANLGGPELAGQVGQSTTQDRQLGFLNAAADRRTVTPDRVTPPASPYVLQAGAVIPAALITGIRSDLPGQITAQVTENVYDSPTGRSLLIPQGTRVIGQYDNGVGFGQRRVLLVWSRLVFPNGRSIVLERQPGTDAQGYAGLEDGVDYHWAELFKAAALTTILSVGAEAGSSGQESDIVRALRGGASDSLSQVGQQIVQRQLNIAPTLTIRPGFNVRVVVTRDLVLEPYGG